jgi:hypothetical protein
MESLFLTRNMIRWGAKGLKVIKGRLKTDVYLTGGLKHAFSLTYIVIFQLLQLTNYSFSTCYMKVQKLHQK